MAGMIPGGDRPPRGKVLGKQRGKQGYAFSEKRGSRYPGISLKLTEKGSGQMELISVPSPTVRKLTLFFSMDCSLRPITPHLLASHWPAHSSPGSVGVVEGKYKRKM